MAKNARDLGVGLANFNETNIWFSPGTEINSTEAFSHASRLENAAYLANRWLFIAIMIIIVLFVVIESPHAIIRMRWRKRWWYNARLLGPEDGSQPTSSSPKASPPRPPRRFPHLRLPFPIYRVPGFDLPLRDFLLVLLLWAVGLGIAGWCQATFLTHSSRSTLVVMDFVCLTAALGIKAGGIGTWVSRGYSTLNFLHRWTGRLVFVLTTLHVVAYLIIFYRSGIVKQEMKKPENYLSVVAYAGLTLTGLVSIRPIRRNYWIIFKFGHHFGILLLLAGLNYHSPDTVPYILTVWGLITINGVFRAVTTRFTKATIRRLPGAESTLVTFPALTRGFTPGQHVRVRLIPPRTRHGLVSWTLMLESHPFTIASADLSTGGIQLVIKRAGDWTSTLYALATTEEQMLSEIKCSVEGPYGGPLNMLFEAFESVLIIAGGSGISFGLGVVRGLIANVHESTAACKNLTLVWTVKNREYLDALGPLLNDLLRSVEGIELVQPDFHLTVILAHSTKLASSDSPPPSPTAVLSGKEIASPVGEKQMAPPLLETAPGPQETTLTTVILIEGGRPNLAVILEEAVELAGTGKGGLGVGSCGPKQLTDGVEKLVRLLPKEERKRVGGVEVHTERFSL